MSCSLLSLLPGDRRGGLAVTPPLHITIVSTEDGYFRWELRNSPSSAFAYAGSAPLLERCFEELIRTQWVLADNLTRETHAPLPVEVHDPPDPSSIAQVQTPPGNALPAQQDIPSHRHAS